MIALVALASTFALAPGAPAAAYGPGADSSPGVVAHRSGFASWDLIIDRPTTQHLAAFARKWDKSIGPAGQLAAGLACSRWRHPAVIALCVAVITLADTYPADRLQQADQKRGCLRISLGLRLPAVAPYDDGRYCGGSRT
ncbi:hypothetical protein [Mangrovihabitans endophyticus]|uniref:Uncharacterized protein n=1 Tax=Mangrovihabitans endophyticus TaxID=1751298 RepID=A0A8J3FS07_9ACTN|nr:hypothetical protein [Mangrovihabitans endophyticus]GGL20770.1 hypothetical protein GCM10012284_64310 [Mangrovihabitans endophyticus]